MDIFVQLLANSVIAGATYTLITLGFNLVYGATKFVNMAHGAVAAAGAYAVLALARSAEVPLAVSVALGVLAAGLVGILTDWLVFRKLRRVKSRPLVMFLASLGLFTMGQALFSAIFGPQLWTLPSAAGSAVFDVGGAAVTGVQLIIIALAVFLSAALFAALRFTMLGKVVRAISDDEDVAKMLGVNTNRVIAAVFFAGSAFAGLGGILIGLDTGVNPTMGLFIIIESVIPSIVGGIGNMAGGVLGAFFLGFAENFGIWFIPSQWKGAIAFGLLTLFLIFRPQGIMGRK